MSESAEVADLEDVFGKASMPIQTTQSDSQENTVNAKSSADVLSEFPDTVLPPREESKKADEINVPVLSDSIGLSEEIQEVLIESTIVAENTGLVPVVEVTKTITETTTAVTGSVELAEEIMEAFANSKSVLDTENPVSNDACALQEELDRLEQLAVERVREIEGDLVNSTKQMTECNISLNVPKEFESTDGTGNKQEEFVSEMAVPDASGASAKEVGESLCEDVMPCVDLTSPSELVSVVPEISSAVVGVEKKQIKPSNIDLSESVVDSAITQEKEAENTELIDIDALESEKTTILEGKNDDPAPEPKGKIENPVMEIQEKSNDEVLKLKGEANSSVSEVEAVKGSELVREAVDILCDLEGKSEKKNTEDCEKNSEPGESEISRGDGGKKELIGDKNECSVTADTQVTQEVIVEKQCLSDKSGANKDNFVKMGNANKNIPETDEATVATVAVEEGKQIKDIQNYETEDDDLEVLEAFIVKTATNPELAVCTVKSSKDDNVSKYSLESSLLDDLTKADNGSSTNEVENRSGKLNEDSPLIQSACADSAHETSSQKIASSENSADTNSKASENAVECHLGLQASSVPSERKISDKEGASETSGDEIVCIDNAAKGSNKTAEKKVVFVEVKRRTGRPLISGKKASIGDTSILLRKESTEQTGSEKLRSQKGIDEKPAKQDQSSNKRSMRNSKKMKIDEENLPSTSGTLSAQKGAEQSGVSKIQKKSVEQNSDSSASTSKTTLKINENKGEVRPTTVVNVETSSKEKKKPKDMESNNDEKPTIHADLESSRENRNVENDCASKPSKKDERRLKENVETPADRNIKRQNNNSDVTNSRSTRSAKKTITVKSSQPTNVSEHTKEKNKENVEKSINVPVGDGDIKRKTERSVPKETPLKNEVGQPQKRSRTSTEDGRDVKKKNDGNIQISAAIKQSRNERVEGLPDSQASTSTPKKAGDNSDRGSASPKVPSVSVTQKAAEERNLHDSGTPVKRKRAEKETEHSFPDVSPTSVKRKRGNSGGKEISAVRQIPPDVLKRKKADTETDITLSSQSFQASPTILKHKSVGREFEQNMPNDEIEYTRVTPCDSNKTSETLHRIPNVYSDSLFVEFEEITFDMLQSKAKQLVLPTPLWGAQVSSGKELVAFSRLRADLSDDKPMIDKALVFQGSLKPIALINNEPVDLPIPCVRTFEDVVMLIRNFHSVSFCEGTGVKQRPQSKSCFRYLDVANPGGRCSQCLEERRRVLFGCARKLRERINVMKAAKSHQ
ncbi:Protein of unknown function [Gryllus bimaculatus]|nr:Protein of unknown function [Gryllus bimaculatus]